MNFDTLRSKVEKEWAEHSVPSLAELIRIPAVSSAYDPSWQQSGHLHRAASYVKRWVEGRDIPGVQCAIVELDGRPPVLLIEVPATTDSHSRQDTVVFYGHLDRVSPISRWTAGRDPWAPTSDGDHLYGRGTVDDGYAVYAVIGALVSLRAAGGVHSRVVVLLETAEESAPIMPAYLDVLGERLGDVSLVMCLDSVAQDHDRLWLTTSMRGIVQATLTVQVLDAPAHVGLTSGIVPDSFRIIRRLLDRVEDGDTGAVRLAEMNIAIPDNRRAEAIAAAGVPTQPQYPLTGDTRRVSDEPVELILNNTWRPALSISGAAGLPDPSDSLPIMRNSTALQLSFLLPPTVKAERAARELIDTMTEAVPYDAKILVSDMMLANGWDALPPAPWLTAAVEMTERNIFDAGSRSIGLGGGIPALETLASRYPRAEFFVTGALRPDSNAHGLDEWLSISYARKLTAVVAYVIDAHARRPR